jgi:putative FmdB family regulatory protein
MPIYEYEHTVDACSFGEVFEVQQSMQDPPLTHCPNCGEPVHKIISKTGISVAKSNSELRDLGFTKLVKRDDGVYENVTARDGESRYVRRGQSETLPDVRKTIRD